MRVKFENEQTFEELEEEPSGIAFRWKRPWHVHGTKGSRFGP